MKHVGVVIADRGSAIVSVERSPDNALLVTGIERLPSDLGPVTERIWAFAEPDARFVVDAEGLGSALWAVLGPPRDKHHWTLYTGRGFERQALVDELLVAMQQERFHFAPRLAEQEAMGKALQSYRRQVREDGVIGSELVVALLLAIIPPPRKYRHASF
jgi:hypothetical protein